MNLPRQLIYYFIFGIRFPHSRIGFGATVDKLSKLGKDCRIDRNSWIINSKLSEEVTVGGQTGIVNSTLGKAINIQRDCSIVGSKLDGRNVIYSNTIMNNVQIGSYSYIAHSSDISFTNIGKFCSIGSQLISGGGTHPTDWISTSPVFYSVKKQCGTTFAREQLFQEYSRITIGNDVWIGSRVILRDGVTIGHGAIIAAGAVIVNDIPPFAIVGGVPGKIIRYRFSDEIIEKLLKLEWWNWDEEKIKNNYKLFANSISEINLEEIAAYK